jgi:hypothetical protein
VFYFYAIAKDFGDGENYRINNYREYELLQQQQQQQQEVVKAPVTTSNDEQDLTDP